MQVVAEMTVIKAVTLLDELLDAYNALRRERWDKFPFIEAAIQKAKQADTTCYKPEQRQAVNGLLNIIVPDYEAKKREYEINPDSRKKDMILGDYRMHMAALQQVEDGINHWRITPDAIEAYAKAISATQLFYAQNQQVLPEKERAALASKLGSARKILPSRSDCRR